MPFDSICKFAAIQSMKDHRITKRGGLKSFAWLLLILAGRKNVKLCPLSGWLAENYFHPYSAGTSELVGNKVNARFLSEVEQSECKVNGLEDFLEWLAELLLQ